MRKSFIIYNDSLDVLDMLSSEQIGKLFLLIRAYNRGEEYQTNDKIVDVAFSNFKGVFDRDNDKYNNVCDRNARNGAKGGRPKNKPKEPSGLLQNPEKPKKADSDSDSDSDKENKLIYNIEDYVEGRNSIKQIKQNSKTVKGLPETRKITDKMRTAWKKISKEYTAQEIKDATNKYIEKLEKTIPNEKRDGTHRYTLYEFITRDKGLQNYINS